MHDKNQLKIYFFHVVYSVEYSAVYFVKSANLLLTIFSIEFHRIYSSYLILLVRLGEILGGPHVLTLFVRFYFISDAVSLVQWRAVIGIYNCWSSAIPYHVCNLTEYFVSMLKVLLYCWHYFEIAFIYLLTLVHILIIL